MPTYLYICEVNNEEFEEMHSISIKLEECPKCKELGLPDHAPKRLINSLSRGVVELTGNELVAKTKEDVAKLKKDLQSSESLYSNFLGTDKYRALQTKIDKNKRERGKY